MEEEDTKSQFCAGAHLGRGGRSNEVEREVILSLGLLKIAERQRDRGDITSRKRRNRGCSPVEEKKPGTDSQ